ncbi:pyridoxal phosphate-dependent aminotransferase [Lichenicola cladoniae]|uniref:cysteine-S-conjugate beta-lyase n=1 Tax=Lichenicola cladoniae TaxID=1484109 RepID=A0A6M8HL29_9PROT|nr:MalY/PatB family protein [Lichenicola cladoniae]NPD65240.1 pyridoxal phosphate-dependent aminotransferase [Acetobacteraceae bacterium]QKE88835.1 pyridoxal phosphate-dependent aminotransferase [Lichenicola cladoniae]
MPLDFDAPVDRIGTDCSKWSRYGPDVLPLWVADMDFAVAPGIVSALQARLQHPVFGYAAAGDGLRAQIVAELRESHDWTVGPEEIVFLPGVEPGFNMALRALLRPGDTVAVQTPIYRPILNAPGHWGMQRLDLPLHREPGGWSMDREALEEGIGRSQALLLCNPHNPTGKVFTRDELAEIAVTCLSHGTLIISDEIHCDLLHDGRRHVPIASIDPGVSDRTITLMAASKTYNIAGLKCAFAIIRNRAMRATFEAHRLGMVDSVNALGLVATEAAYATGKPWKTALLTYLQANRDYLVEAVRTRLPGLSMQAPEGTFLSWLDCTEARLGMPAQQFFLDRAKVGLNNGSDYDAAAGDFVRLNFGCTRAVLEAAIGRMEASLSAG